MKPPAKPQRENERKKRLAQQLRANLARRKEQAREREAEPDNGADITGNDASPPPPENDT